MDDQLVYAFKEKNYAYILKRLQPLFWKNLRGVALQDQDDFLQEYYLLCIKIVAACSFQEP
ncbi:hypothetical protein [Jeotgalibaca ciconiae]|uniref:Sigma-70 family RNA polymerase sigma factor n=1 Tax=Jeotgalibaca ciconiae TaxID=2496265 RepID=A0A3Q9BKC7_9LACT|nr:hypothetical protein [Jeotgalibaca ciconiae]AZP04301.1 hypothetical protein EJN90_06410 [Jeotgalibaca ciconiae]